MRLTGIRLAGFKTFVDPTKVSFLGNRSAVVGPNGCGKSNIIDAVRWVIGEGSPRRLRGQSSTDVIFEGSSAREATSMASVELTFDNADGRVGGQYARFGEIAVRREVQRNGQSSYFLNGTRCRRRDVVDVFLGTGFGSRGYAIIEQGMISELVAAKPDDLRAFLEEAAGISRYKERRRETERRMKVTRENLERLEDIRAELATRLGRLQRQAKDAARYRDLRADKRRRTAELALLRLRAVEAELAAAERSITQLDTAHQERLSKARRLDAALGQARIVHRERADALRDLQGHAWRVEADIGRAQETLRHRREQEVDSRSDLEQAERRAAETEAQLAEDEGEIGRMEAALADRVPALAAARRLEADTAAELADAERELSAWQAGWDDFNARAAESERELSLEADRADRLEEGLAGLRRRLEELASEPRVPVDDSGAATLDAAFGEAERRRDGADTALDACARGLSAAREELEAGARSVDAARREVQRLENEAAVLGALQEADLGRANGEAGHWLEARGLRAAPRLGEGLVVAPGWENAAEAVLGGCLQAVRVDDTARYVDALDELHGGRVALYEGTPLPREERTLPALASLVRTEQGPIGTLLAGVFAADSLKTALAARADLAPGESVVTRDGVWLGPDWIRLDRGEEDAVGVVRRGIELEALGVAGADARRRLASAEEALARIRAHADALESERERLQAACRESADALAALRAERDVLQVRIDEARAGRQRVERDRARARDGIAADTARLTAARSRIAELSGAAETLESERRERGALRERLGERVGKARTDASTAREALHALKVEHERQSIALDAARSARERLHAQRSDLAERVKGLRESIDETVRALPELEGTLEDKLAQRLALEKDQGSARRKLEEAESDIADLVNQCRDAAAAVDAARDRVEEARRGREGIAAQRGMFEGQLAQTGLSADEVAESLPPDAEEETWVAHLEGLERRITRLGAINLAAIEEYEQESERKRFLDAEHADIEKALATLQAAMTRIDRETRTRFRTTFDEVNGHLKTLFPKLFGGGRAYLELTGDNLLDTGVRLMARPPGKRNSNVHMLSGGEKALAAIALVFAIFELNPSPVCLLDEVDAPLDDTNVGRFAELLHEMSQDVQFVVITHNKLTMEMADHLLGVTMNEPGVSRLVSVDVEEAAALAVV